MKLEDYKSGEYVKMHDYKAFIPSKIQKQQKKNLEM